MKCASSLSRSVGNLKLSGLECEGGSQGQFTEYAHKCSHANATHGQYATHAKNPQINDLLFRRKKIFLTFYPETTYIYIYINCRDELPF